MGAPGTGSEPPSGRGLTPPDPPLSDGVVLLRPPVEGDAPAIAEACADPRLQRFLPVPRPYGIADAEAYVAASRAAWAGGRKAVFTIADATEPTRLRGVISLSIAGPSGNCGYWVAPDARGRGVARRALRLVCDWAFAHLDLALVLAEISEDNRASAEVARAAGFHRTHAIEVPGSVTGERSRVLHLRLVSDPPVPAG